MQHKLVEAREKGVNDSIQKYEADAYCSPESYDAMKCYRESKAVRPHNPIADQEGFCREFWHWSLSLIPAIESP